MIPNPELAKKLNKFAYAISAIVLFVVAVMRKIHFDTEIDFSFLPAVYSTMNAVVAIILLIALYFVKNKNIEAHKKSMIAAMIFSFVFLALYVLYHTTTPETKYCGEGFIRKIYFFLLISHVVLAAVIFPFILFTFIKGYTYLVEKHKKMAKWVFPFWLYVALTGPILYLMLKPCYL
jgi:putative membrane protein